MNGKFYLNVRITQHIESIDTEECSIALSTRKNVESRMAESNISHDIRALHQIA